MITYAQNFEDVVLARAFAGRRDGFYIDVGACFPDVASVTRHFYELGWSGVNVEPMDEPYLRLCADRPRDVNVRAAIAARNGEIGIFPGPSVGESSALRRDAAAQPIVVPCLTLAELCALHASRAVDFLKIDVEGLELDVIRGGDWTAYRPRVVVVEVSQPWSTERRADAREIDGFFRDRAYREVYYDGLNAFYVAEEASALTPLLACPPNVLDGFETVREAQFDGLTASLEHAQAAARHADALSRKLDDALAGWRAEQARSDAQLAFERARAEEAQAASRTAEALARENATRADWALARFDALKAQIDAANRWAEAAVDDLKQRLQAAHARAEQAEAHARHAQAAFASIEASRSWRLTAPLRKAFVLLRRASTRRSAHTAHPVRSAAARVIRATLRIGKRSRAYGYVAPLVRRRFPHLWARARRTLHDAASALVEAPPPLVAAAPLAPAAEPPPPLSADTRSLSVPRIAEMIKHEAARQRRD